MHREKYWKMPGFMAAAAIVSMAWNVNLEQSVNNEKILYQEASAEETESLEDLLIEDDGEVAVNKSGIDLEELIAAERESEEQARMQMEELLEDPQLVLEPARKDKLQEYLEELMKEESPIGSDGELLCSRYISRVMEECGYTVSEQSFHEGFLNEDGVDAPGVNIIAERGADSENRTNGIFIIGTHYDSKTKPEPQDPFANDKTGAAVLLEIARILSYVDTDTDICFLFLSGEEDGLYGSVNFIKSLSEENKARITGVLYVEKVGYDSDYPYVLGTADGEENDVGNLVRAEGWLAEHTIIPAGEEAPEDGEGLKTESQGNAQEEEETDKRVNWEYVCDQESSQNSFADAGLLSVTVCQDISWEQQPQSGTDMTRESKAADVVAENIDMKKLQSIADILAAAVGQIMIE